ncbi:MAG TPA: hypothetical protein VGP62_04035 [Bryobacteraceae bacterium]|jgi:hypothetical protein|nr:hypothetical protein [Bryobacteraceae bacterium]
MGKVLLLTVWLAMQVVPPMPGQQPGASGKGSDKATDDRQGNKRGAGQPITIPAHEPKDSGNEGHTVAAQDKEQSVKLTSIPTVTVADKQKTWIDYLFDWGPWVFSLVLVFVGVVGVILARRTLGTMDRQANLMGTQATLMEQQADLMRASMTQWVSVVNWQSSLVTLFIPSPSPEPKALLVQFDIANESSFPLTARFDFKFFGNLPNRVRLRTIQDTPMFPRKPYKCEVRLPLAEEQSKQYLETILRIAVHGEIVHVGVAKEQSPLMSIRGNLVCGMNRPTYLEYEDITMIPMAQQRTETQTEDQKPN